MVTINIAKDFSATPGARYKADGPSSGEKFREDLLEKHFLDPNDDSVITIILDGTEGYATSFLEEAFGGLARKYGSARCLKRFKFVSVEESSLVDEIIQYIRDAEK
jgi:hypothetical protein